jgi:hypothetical protein
MAVVETQVDVVMVQLFCDECGEEMICWHVLTVYPPIYVYRDKNKHEFRSPNRYPDMKYIPKE